jgi:hypothetical protein
VELLDADTPAGVRQAVCDNRAGFVHAVGNEAAYSFDRDDDIGETHTLVFNVGSDTDELTLADEPGELCDPFVRVVTLADGAVVWVAAQTFAALYNLADGALLGRQDFAPLFLTGPVRHVLLNNGTLIASGSVVDEVTGEATGIIVRRISDAALQPAVATVGLKNMIAGDPSGQAALFRATNGTFTLQRPIVDEDSEVVSYEERRRPVAFAAQLEPTRILVLHGDDADIENDVVVGMNDLGDVQIEGGALHEERRHNRFAVAFGRAIILAGNQEGHDVLVRDFDDAERGVLESRTTN